MQSGDPASSQDGLTAESSQSCFLDDANATVFTFFSEFGSHWSGQTVVETLVLCVVLLAAIVCNSMVLLMIVRNPRMRTTSNYVIGSLSVADVIMAFGIPFILATRWTRDWLLGDELCKGVVYVQFVSGVASILSLTLISVERYFHIAMPLARPISIASTFKLLVGSWVLSFLFPLPVAFAQTVKTVRCPDGEHHYCGVTWSRHFPVDVYMGALTTVFFVLPVIVMTVCYVRIFLVVRGSSVKVKDAGRRSGPASRISRLQLRLVKISVIVVLGFVVMWLPFFILSFLGLRDSSITSTQFTATLILALSNSALNPVIYGYFNTSYRREFKDVCKSCCQTRPDPERRETGDLQQTSGRNRRSSCNRKGTDTGVAMEMF